MRIVFLILISHCFHLVNMASRECRGGVVSVNRNALWSAVNSWGKIILYLLNKIQLEIVIKIFISIVINLFLRKLSWAINASKN